LRVSFITVARKVIANHGVVKDLGEGDRGRESQSAPPPSEPDWRISRIRLSG
jgi:hypothetical protein